LSIGTVYTAITHHKLDWWQLTGSIATRATCHKIKYLVTSYKVTTHLENMEKSGNSKVVRENSGKMKKVRGN